MRIPSRFSLRATPSRVCWMHPARDLPGRDPGQDDDGLVHGIWWDDHDAHSGLLTAAEDRAPLINSPVGYGSGGQHVVFEGGDNQVYYLDWDIDDGLCRSWSASIPIRSGSSWLDPSTAPAASLTCSAISWTAHQPRLT